MIRHIARLLIIPSLFVVVLFVWVVGGYVVNTSESLPLGLYRARKAATPRVGDVVIFCLENAEMAALARSRAYLAPGNCPGELTPLLKIVYGLPGDEVSLDAERSIYVNRIKLDTSRPLPQDGMGRDMPSSALQPGVIPEGQALLLALNRPNSFDARYWGLQPLANLKVVKPVWVSSEGELK